MGTLPKTGDAAYQVAERTLERLLGLSVKTLAAIGETDEVAGLFKRNLLPDEVGAVLRATVELLYTDALEAEVEREMGPAPEGDYSTMWKNSLMNGGMASQQLTYRGDGPDVDTGLGFSVAASPGEGAAGGSAAGSIRWRWDGKEQEWVCGNVTIREADGTYQVRARTADGGLIVEAASSIDQARELGALRYKAAA